MKDVNMDDAGALFFSYVLDRHLHPEYLRVPMKAGPALTQLEEYDSKSGCLGIIYETSKLSQFGIRLLRDAEQSRSQLLKTREAEDDMVEHDVLQHAQ